MMVGCDNQTKKIREKLINEDKEKVQKKKLARKIWRENCCEDN